MLNIFPSTNIQRKMILIESLMNTTDKLSKVSPHSVTDGFAEGIAKIAGKAEKDIILSISQLFPDNASGTQLDQVAINFGIAGRFGALGSSTYVRLVGVTGTEYLKSTHLFTAVNGARFELATNVTIGIYGFIYAKVQSLDAGATTLVGPLTINKVTPAPVGHQYVINEYMTIGGRDIESDQTFRIRIKDSLNLLARSTMSMLEQLFISINPNVLRLVHMGHSSVGKIRIGIYTQNGATLSDSDLGQLLLISRNYFALTEYRPYGSNFYGVELVNAEYEYIDVSFRCQIDPSISPDVVRQRIQIGMSKYLDHRYFNPADSKVEWDNLLQIVKNEVLYVPDQLFYPRSDVFVNTYKLPRLRGFLMLDMEGNVISNTINTLTPIYYPNNPDFSYQASILRRL